MTLAFTLRTDVDWRGLLVPGFVWDGQLTINTNQPFEGEFEVLRARMEPQSEVMSAQEPAVPAFLATLGFKRGVTYRLAFDMAPPFLMARFQKPKNTDSRPLAGGFVCVIAQALGDDPAERARTMMTLGQHDAGRYRMSLRTTDDRESKVHAVQKIEAPTLVALHEGNLSAGAPVCTN